MGKIVIFGAGGAVRVATGDVTSVPDIIALAAGQDAAIHAAAVYGEGTDPASFFPGAAPALAVGLPQAGVGRLVAVGLAALLPGPDGIPLLDAGYEPQQAAAPWAWDSLGTSA
jgi:uncharacterized protein